MLLMILVEKKFLELFAKKNCKKQIKKDLESKKQKRNKAINYMLNLNDILIGLIVG